MVLLKTLFFVKKNNFKKNVNIEYMGLKTRIEN